jgi:hypothetical protein
MSENSNSMVFPVIGNPRTGLYGATSYRRHGRPRRSRSAAADLLEAVVAQAQHALVDRDLGDRVGGVAGHRHVADRLGDAHMTS